MWDYASANSGQIVNTCDRMRFPAPINGIAPLASPRYFQVTDTPAGRFLYVCDNYGVYKASFISNPPTVSEMLWDAEVGSGIPSYRAMDRNSGVIGNQYLGVPLQASCVHVLPNQNWLITNSYSGTDKQGTANFSGEVFEYSPITGEIEWHSPDLEWYADFSWKQRIGNGQIPQQPSCAYRQF
jgi:hypothetical protein